MQKRPLKFFRAPNFPSQFVRFLCDVLTMHAQPDVTLQTHSTKARLFWCLFAAVLAPLAIVTADLLRTGWLYHGSGNHTTESAFIIGISLGSWFVLKLPLHWNIRIICLLLYIPLAWIALIPYSLWFIAVVFHGMAAGG